MVVPPRFEFEIDSVIQVDTMVITGVIPREFEALATCKRDVFMPTHQV
jgi:hypothetical protein